MRILGNGKTQVIGESNTHERQCGRWYGWPVRSQQIMMTLGCTLKEV